MNQYPNSSNLKPETWGNLLGTFVRASDMSEDLRTSPGLILLESAQGTEVCPHFQFDKDKSGQPRVNPHVGLAWSLLSALHVDQLDENKWTVAGMLTQPREELGGLN